VKAQVIKSRTRRIKNQNSMENNMKEKI